ncbi:MAG: peptidase M20 [Myxococcales bacterium]|nr:peptidase M20 [Myxococcales bacterium]
MQKYFETHHERYIRWRHDLHAHPETAFEEYRTAAFVASKLKSFGLEVTEGLAKTGVVGVLKAVKDTQKKIGLRADLDALPMTEEARERPHCSRHDGKMHACGHDGHTVMLLAAAEYLSTHPLPNTEVVFIFQPAEENVAGGKVMVDEGLFDQFPVEQVFGLHNLPNQPFGHIAARIGPQMASADMFKITLSGQGGHAAWPHQCDDVILAASELVSQAQALVSRLTDPLQAAVLSVTQFHAGESDNVLPSTVTLRGTVRALDEQVRANIEAKLECLARSHAQLKGLELTWHYDRRYTATVNEAQATQYAMDCAEELWGKDRVDRQPAPLMGAEDFGWMLRVKDGCYALLGAGPSPMLHHPHYDFNDDLIPLGASYWVKLAQGLELNSAYICLKRT